MKILKKVFTAMPVLALAVGIMSPFGAYAADNAGTTNANAINDEMNKEIYSKMEGAVTLIDSRETATFIRLEEEQNVIDFRIGENTILVTIDGIKSISEIKEGDKLTAYYIMPLANILIYPPQMDASVFINNEASTAGFFIVDRFDENLVSSNNRLKLNISETTKIINTKGEVITADLAGRDLVVHYTVSTKSIPAQTTPDLIIVLDSVSEEDMAATDIFTNSIHELTPEEKESFNKQLQTLVENADIVVYDKSIKAPKAYISESSQIMLPLRTVAEAAGYDVVWDAELKAITVGKTATLTIGKDYYTFAEMAPMVLGQAPVIMNSITYVPITFFSTVMRLDATLVDSNIIINQPINDAQQ